MSSRHLNTDIVDSDDEVRADATTPALRSWLTQPTGPPTADSLVAATWRSWTCPLPATVVPGSAVPPTPKPPPPKMQVGVAAAMYAANAIARAVETAAKANMIAAKMMADYQKASSAATRSQLRPATNQMMADYVSAATTRLQPPPAKAPTDNASPAQATAKAEYTGKGKAVAAKAKTEAKTAPLAKAEPKTEAKVTAKAKTEAKKKTHKRPAAALHEDTPAVKRPAAAPAMEAADAVAKAPAIKRPAAAPAKDAPAMEAAAEAPPALSHTWLGRRPPKDPVKLAEFRRKQRLHAEGRAAAVDVAILPFDPDP
jgi:hypothetical protein